MSRNKLTIPEQSALYIGVMSGTSADGIDLALVDFSQGKSTLLAEDFIPYPENMHQAITALYLPNHNEIDRAYQLDVELAEKFAHAINHFLAKHQLRPEQIIAIGNHGQTIRHRPKSASAFTLQITCNQTLAALTNIRVIGDFRTKDMVYGGQGAPLVPAFHQYLFKQFTATAKDVIVVNIGGIANISYLPPAMTSSSTPSLAQGSAAKPVLGFDTGPGNGLMDSWYQQHQTGQYDNNGQWASSGECHQGLLAKLLADDYFSALPPKSTGREYFHLDWLAQFLVQFQQENISAVDIQATLLALTATSISQDIKRISQNANIYLCGGGALNGALVAELEQQLNVQSSTYLVTTIETLGINNSAFEAMAFAWFAYAFDHNLCGNIPSVTGASKALILGVEYQV
ncbi:MAG: anhydro-N-acetylmuramic acid kinase [Thalassotalea sp.]